MSLSPNGVARIQRIVAKTRRQDPRNGLRGFLKAKIDKKRAMEAKSPGGTRALFTSL
jgi:hypothetical protein